MLSCVTVVICYSLNCNFTENEMKCVNAVKKNFKIVTKKEGKELNFVCYVKYSSTLGAGSHGTQISGGIKKIVPRRALFGSKKNTTMYSPWGPRVTVGTCVHQGDIRCSLFLSCLVVKVKPDSDGWCMWGCSYAGSHCTATQCSSKVVEYRFV